jgi:5'-nucleotidase/UDP-sugar diphosphatase
VADDATPANPVTLTIDDMYTLMPYENSLLAMSMNGPQIKQVLERAYRNYYYYKYVEDYGGYSHYTTCMLDINEGAVITYNDTYPALPDGNNVMSLVFDGTSVDFTDADTYYTVSTVNYLAAGSCNFNDAGITIWPLDQITADTQYYVRDSVITYITDMGTISPQVEGRLQFVHETYIPFVTKQASLPKQITILHTNDFHGQLETDYRGRGGSAYMAGKINEIRSAVGADNVALMDAGDVYFAAQPVSQLVLGESAIDAYNMIGYDVAAFGNHEFDKGQTVLISRTMQSDFPWIGANIVLEGTDWEHPTWVEPYVILDVGSAGNEAKLGVIGLDTDETPLVTLKGTTDGLVFEDLTEAVLHYYDEVMAQSDALIVLAHMGSDDSGAYKGLKTVAQELIDAGKPVDLMIGGHQHQALYDPVMVGDTAIVSAGYYGRYLGRVDASIDPATKKLTLVDYELMTINNELTADPDVEALVAYWASIVAPFIEQPVGTSIVDLVRDYNAESNMGNLVTDSMLWKADEYDDGEVNGSVDIAFTNPGGLRAEIEIPEGTPLPYTITWGDTFNVLPFGNTLFLMDLTGEQIQALLDQAATLFKGILQSAGISWYWYNDCDCDAPTAWGAYNAMVNGEPLDPSKTYRVVTNNFLAGGQDGWVTFADGTNRWDTYYDMQEGANEYIQWYNANVGPIDHEVEGRIVKLENLVTILHTNDFHGQLETDYRGRGGSAYMAGKINEIRSAVGADNVALVDAGDVYFAAQPVSQLVLGESAIDVYNLMGYEVAAFGNHEFDKGQTVLISRTMQSDFPWIGANIVLEGTDWEHPTWVEPYTILSKGGVDLGIIGLDTDETPLVTLKGTTDGLVFEDLTEAVLHYYDEVMAQSDALIVVAHMGSDDSGAYKGLKTVAQELIDAGKPVDLMIGGHQHQALSDPVMVGDTAIVSAGYYGRYLGRVDASIDPATKKLTLVDYELMTINNTLTPDPDVEALVAYWASIVAPFIEQPVGTSIVDLVRDYNAESNMGNLVTDSMLWKADQYDDGEVNGSVDIAFTNPGGLRAEIEIPDGTPLPYTITWGDTFNVLPFGNTLFLMDLTGEQIQDLLDQAATLFKGILQSAGISWYWYNDCDCDAPTAWGAYNAMVNGEPLDPSKTYRVVTNNFLAGGQDGWVTFADGTNRWDTYYDMQEGANEYIQWYNANVGPIDHEVEGRIVKLDKVVTILHANDTHGNWVAGSYRGTPNGMELLASAIAAEREKNPNTLLLDAGDTFQGNAFAQYFRNATPNPIAEGLNLLEYDAFVLGNHEFNFGPTTFATMLGQLDMPILGSANVDDDGSYGFINDNVDDYITLDVDGLDVAIFGLTNSRVYRYELPTNIPGLTFFDAVASAQSLVPQILADEEPDLLIGLTHIGYAPYAGELDSDVLVAEGVAGIDVIVGGHSHTRLDPSVIVTSTINPEGTLIAQAERYAMNLGKVNIGFSGNMTDGYEVVFREGYLLPAGDYDPDPTMTTFLEPFLAELDAYTSQEIGQTTAPIDALEAYTEETSGANVQCDAAVWELAQHGIDVDFHLSGAMSNRKVADDATPANPVTLTIDDMYTLMPYENSLLAMSMNGPQIKQVLERAYRNYYYYKYVEDYGGYSHYTTCMLDINEGAVITYNDTYPALPDGNNVMSLVFDGTSVDFTDADTYYTVSTVNYLAAGSCNFNDAGVTIWPLDQITADTQYYVRDSVITYISDMGTISPQVEGRLNFVQ